MPSGLAEAAAGAGVSISAAARFTGEFAISTSNTALSTVSLTPWDGFDFEVISGGLGVSVGKLYVVGEIDDSKSDDPSTWLAVSSGTTIYINAKNVYDEINVNTLSLKCDYTDPGNHRHNFNIGCSVQNQGWYVNATTAYATANSKGHFYILSTHQCSGGGIGDSGDQSDWLKGIYTDAWDDASKSVETPPTSSPGTSFVVKVPKEGKGDATGSKVTSLTFTMTQFDNSSTQNKNVMYVKYDGSVVGQFQHNQYANGWKDAIATISVSHNSSRSGNKVTAKGKVTYKATWDAVANTSVEGDEATYTATVKDTHAVSDDHAVSKSGGINLDNSSTYAKLGTKHTTANYTAYEVSDSHVLGSGTGSANENWYRNSQISLSGSSSLTGGVSIEWS